MEPEIKTTLEHISYSLRGGAMSSLIERLTAYRAAWAEANKAGYVLGQTPGTLPAKIAGQRIERLIGERFFGALRDVPDGWSALAEEAKKRQRAAHTKDGRRILNRYPALLRAVEALENEIPEEDGQ